MFYCRYWWWGTGLRLPRRMGPSFRQTRRHVWSWGGNRTRRGVKCFLFLSLFLHSVLTNSPVSHALVALRIKKKSFSIRLYRRNSCENVYCSQKIIIDRTVGEISYLFRCNENVAARLLKSTATLVVKGTFIKKNHNVNKVNRLLFTRDTLGFLFVSLWCERLPT